MVGTLKDLSDTTFNISDVLPRYRLERLGNSYFLKLLIDQYLQQANSVNAEKLYTYEI